MEHDGCVGCKYEDEPSNSLHCQSCVQNALDKYVVATNADRIRSMTDEELAEIIMRPFDTAPDECNSEVDCVTCCLNWLKSPAVSKEETE